MCLISSYYLWVSCLVHFSGRHYCVDATHEDGSYGRIANHCKKNSTAYTKAIYSNNKIRLIILAKKSIHIGEEITIDYGERRPEIIEKFPWLKN
jgi:SET domain-containing protein